MNKMNAATELFAIPELCGLIFEHLPLCDIFALQNLTRGVRLYLYDYGPWQTTLFHRDAFGPCSTVKPVLPQGDDLKRVEWIYTSGSAIGGKIPPSLGLWPDSRWLSSGPCRHSTRLLWRELIYRRNASVSRDTNASQLDCSAEASPVGQPSSSSLVRDGQSSHHDVERFIRQATGILDTVRAQSNNESVDGSAVTPHIPAVRGPQHAVRTADNSSATQVPVASSTFPQDSFDNEATSTVNRDHLRSPRQHVPLRPRPRIGTNHYQLQFVALNWLLKDKFPRWAYYPISNMLGLEEPFPIGGFFTNPDASYRPLLLMVPPLSEVTVMDWEGRMFEIKNSQGITMGDVIDAILGR